MNILTSCGFLFFILFGACLADEEGFLEASCDKAQDCYVLDDVRQGLYLACYENVHKCACRNTINTDFHLTWKDNKCLMSKYGPCGDKGNGLAVGCSDDFICVDNQCRDPKDTNAKSVKLTPFVFSESICSTGSCQFSEELSLECDRTSDSCTCKKVYIADGRGTYWDIRNYDGDNDCSVGKFGPCGTKNGITIECHGEGISCVDGTCLNADHPISELGENCESEKDCKEGLLCSFGSLCIEPLSLAEGQVCSSDNECMKGLQCKHGLPFTNAFCRPLDV